MSNQEDHLRPWVGFVHFLATVMGATILIESLDQLTTKLDNPSPRRPQPDIRRNKVFAFIP